MYGGGLDPATLDGSNGSSDLDSLLQAAPQLELVVLSGKIPLVGEEQPAHHDQRWADLLKRVG